MYKLSPQIFNNLIILSFKSILPENYAENFGVKRQFKYENATNLSKSNTHSLSITQGIYNKISKNLNRIPNRIILSFFPLQELFEAQRTCECKSKQTEYFLFKKDLAVPEYIIQYEYLYKHHVEDVFERELANIETNGASATRLKAEPLSLSQPPMQPPSKSNDILGKLSEEQAANVVARAIHMQIPASIDGDEPLDVNNLVELNLHNTGIASLDFEPVRELKQLKKLIISFNRFTSLRDLNSLVCGLFFVVVETF